MSKNNIIARGFGGDWNIDYIEQLIEDYQDSKAVESYYLCNLSDVMRKFDDWVKKLPRVKPFYAVKCNDDIGVLKTLSEIGCSFDCASASEILELKALEVESDRIIFANTTKMSSHIEVAKNNNVNLMTFDNEDELEKIKKIHSKANLILRIRYSSEKALYKLGNKFGCLPNTEASELLKLAKKFNLNVVGLSFHIGSSCEDYETYGAAIKVCRKLFDVAETIGFKFNILDIGGGFPGNNFEKIDEFASKINEYLDENFPIQEFLDLKIFSEPGRYFVESAFTLVTQIHSRKVNKDSNGVIHDVMYYLNEGVYSNFLFVPLGPEIVQPQIVKRLRSKEKYKTTIWGPTCDSTDKVCEDIEIELMNIDDVLYFLNMGAYTIPLRTPFNNLGTTKVKYFINFNDW
ncbi:CLUMA_CG001428, isoform A [Clunio marinus]|uniref:ornithine decarboxylase n=1 Tax=Clunio marinus TaxID=568069 RepID=A0A1J1HHW6_9DIPT|nr:CLUMA_CG001428, isoform A [Clunio marinus]